MVLQYHDKIEVIESIHPDFFKILKDEKFIVNTPIQDSQNGLQYVGDSFNSFDNVVITINPTLDCNLKCWYCYEQRHKNSVMSQSVLKDSINYITSFLREKSIKSLRLSFSGGEPLLYYKKIISPIIESIKQECTITNTKLYITFTTNGLLITDSILEDLLDISSNVNFQIAFDGARDYHNKVKSLGANFSCYDKAISNSINAIKKGYNVIVRCNYNKSTVSSFIDVVDDLRDYHRCPNLRFLFQRIWQENEDEEMMSLRKSLINSIDAHYKINSNLHTLLGNSLYKCYADYKYNIVINYDGLIYKCTARDFVEKNSIGHITKDGCVYKQSYLNMISERALYGERCSKCRILPICPNCSQVRIEHGFDSCPINIDEAGMRRNIRAAFRDITNIPIDI